MLALSFPPPTLLPVDHAAGGRRFVRKWHQCCSADAAGEVGWGLMDREAPQHPGRPCLHACVMELMKSRNWMACNGLWEGDAVPQSVRGVSRAFATAWVLGSAKRLPHRTLYIPTVVPEDYVRGRLGAAGVLSDLGDTVVPPLFGWAAPVVAFAFPPFVPSVEEGGAPRRALDQYTLAHGAFYGVDMGSYVVLSPFSIFTLEPAWVRDPAKAPRTPEDQYLHFLPPGFRPQTLPAAPAPAAPRRAWALKAEGRLSPEEVFTKTVAMSNAALYRPPAAAAAPPPSLSGAAAGDLDRTASCAPTLARGVSQGTEAKTLTKCVSFDGTARGSVRESAAAAPGVDFAALGMEDTALAVGELYGGPSPGLQRAYKDLEHILHSMRPGEAPQEAAPSATRTRTPQSTPHGTARTASTTPPPASGRTPPALMLERHASAATAASRAETMYPEVAVREEKTALFCGEVQRQLLNVELAMLGIPERVGEDVPAAAPPPAVASPAERVLASVAARLGGGDGGTPSKDMSPAQAGRAWIDCPIPTAAELAASYRRLRDGSGAATQEALAEDYRRHARGLYEPDPALRRLPQVSPPRGRSCSPQWDVLAGGIPSPTRGRGALVDVQHIIHEEKTGRPARPPAEAAPSEAEATRVRCTTSFALLEREEAALRYAMCRAEYATRRRLSNRDYQKLVIDSSMESLQIRETLARHRLERSFFLRLEEPIRRQWIRSCADFAFMDIIAASDPYLDQPFAIRAARAKRAKKRERKLEHLKAQASDLASMGIRSP